MAVLVFRWRTLDQFDQASVDAAIKDDRTNKAGSQGRKPVLVSHDRNGYRKMKVVQMQRSGMIAQLTKRMRARAFVV
jgi:hypothetical protein